MLQFDLERVLFVPVGDPPHRSLDRDPGAAVRLELCELAVAHNDRFEVSRMELDREGPSYTVDTLRALRDEWHGAELFLILGGDQAAALAGWHEPEEVLSLATVASVERTGWSRNAIAVKISDLKGAERLRFFDMPLIQVSSSMIRSRASRGQPIRYLVPDSVAAYIEAKDLYGAAAPAPAS